VLGASFFCSRDDAECSNPGLIFTTIAYQLGQSHPLYAAEVTRALKSDPTIGYSSVPYQLEQLIVKPLRTLQGSFPLCVVVLDALDECKDSGTTSIILSSLTRYVNELSPLKFVITSRPENPITTAFKLKELSPVTERLILHQVELGVVQNDIELYLSSKLALTRLSYGLEETWPPTEDIHALAVLSCGLFIFAATSVNEDRNYSDPERQLARLLRNSPTAFEGSSPHYHLDRLYTQVLSHAFPDISHSLSNELKAILGSIVFLRDPLSSFALERLLGLKPRTVWRTLLHLHSVVIVPEDGVQVIRLLHPSFFDYITSPARCLNSRFVVDAGSRNTLLARGCLDVMKRLRRDICGIKNPSVLNTEVEDLPTRIKTHIPPELQYACRHWAWHVSNGMVSEILYLLEEFCSKYLLYWVEVCSLLGDLRSALVALDEAQRAERDVDSKNLWKGLYAPMKVLNAADDTWNLCIRTMDGHSNSVSSVAFSLDGTRIVSGSDDDTLRLWDAVSDAHLNTLKGHTDCVFSVAFSPDGTRVVSGSRDNTVRLWDVISGAHLNTLIGHASSVYSVTFSPDGTRVVSGSGDNNVRLWDVVSGAHLNTFEGHTNWVNSVGFSSDGTRIVSGSTDKTVRIWDAVSGAHLYTLEGHVDFVSSVGFSPDGTRVVSGSEDNTVRLWDAVGGAHLNTLKAHTDWVNSIAFSPDGTRVVSGSWDCGTQPAVRIWTDSRDMRILLIRSHSPLMAHASCPDPRTKLFDCGM
jgi:WD40 repeat protein